MTEPNPSTRWFWNDWENDVGLKLCSLAAQGLWMRMLCLAARSNPIGYVTMDDEPCTPADLARMVSEPIERVQELLNELDKRKVFSRNRVGTIYNRRMVKKAKQSDTNKKNGQKGGTVSRQKQRGIFKSLGAPSERSPERATERPAERTDERSPARHPEPSFTPTSPRTPIPPKPPLRNSTAAQAVATRFLELRRELWSADGEERIPLLTLEADAEGYLIAGASAAICIEVIERVMRRHAASGKSAIGSLLFFRNSIPDAVASAKQPASNGHAAPAQADDEPGAWKRRAQQEEDSAINLAARGVATPRLSRAMVEKGLADGRIKPEQLASLGYGNLVRSDGAAA